MGSNAFKALLLKYSIQKDLVTCMYFENSCQITVKHFQFVISKFPELLLTLIIVMYVSAQTMDLFRHRIKDFVIISVLQKSD